MEKKKNKKNTSRSLKIVQYQQPGEFEESLRIITLIYWTKMIKISTLRKPAQRSSPSRVKCSFVLYNIDSKMKVKQLNWS